MPFLSFVAEHYATRDVRAKLAAFPGFADQASLPPEAATVHATGKPSEPEVVPSTESGSD